MKTQRIVVAVIKNSSIDQIFTYNLFKLLNFFKGGSVIKAFKYIKKHGITMNHFYRYQSDKTNHVSIFNSKKF
jgi:hypothetical protein